MLLVLRVGLAKESIYTVGVENLPFLPYSQVKDKQYIGILREILDEFGQQENITFRYEALPITRLYARFFAGKIDFKMPANKYWQKSIKDKRNLLISYSSPLVHFLDGVMVQKPNANATLEMMKRIGIVSGFTPAQQYLQRTKDKKLVMRENPSIRGLLEQTLLGRLDGAYVNIYVAEHFLREALQKPDELVFSKKLPYVKGDYHIATLKHQALIKKINKYLIESAAKINNLKKKYGIR